MGGGKTTVSSALMVEDYFDHIYGIESPGIPSKSYEVKPWKLSLVRLVKEENRIIKVPDSYKPYSTTKIIANYHLFGVTYMYAPMWKVLDMINTPMMKDAKWTVDESWLSAESRRGMSPLTIVMTEYAQLMRKLNIELNLLTQHSRFLDWRLRYITKQKMLTSYNKDTHYIRLLIQNLDKGSEKTLHFYAPTYWKYFDTNELPPMPVGMINKAKNWA